jgi:hypothetical protein
LLYSVAVLDYAEVPFAVADAPWWSLELFSRELRVIGNPIPHDWVDKYSRKA